MEGGSNDSADADDLIMRDDDGGAPQHLLDELAEFDNPDDMILQGGDVLGQGEGGYGSSDDLGDDDVDEKQVYSSKS